MKFFDLFPAPRYMMLSDAGISISERSVRFVSLRGSAGNMRVKNYGEISLPEGAISDGVLKDKPALAEALAKLRNEHGVRFATATLSEEKAYLFTTKVERVPYQDLHDAVAFTIEENAPVSLANSVFSFEFLDKASEVRAAVAVLPSEVANSYSEAFLAAGIVPVSFDIEPQAIARALIGRGDKRSHLIVHISEQKVGLYMAEDEMVQFSSTIKSDVAVSKSDEAIAMLKAEIRKFFAFWDARTEGGSPMRVEHIIVSGTGASDDALVAKIMSDVETPYALANVWTNIFPFDKHLPDIPFDASLSYAGAIGAALPQSQNEYV